MLKILICFSLFPITLELAQTLEGTTGLFFIPTAMMLEDGQLDIGLNFVDTGKNSFSYFQNNAFTPYLTFAFLPFVELNLRIIKPIDNISHGIGDRSLSVRIRIRAEDASYPSLVVGLHDIMSVFGGIDAVHNNALYLVSSKNILFNSKLLKSISFHAGYGLNVISARTHNFVGLFGGIALKLCDVLEMMGEYDAKMLNSGLRLTLFNHIKFLVGLVEMKHFSGGVGFVLRL